MVKNKYPEWVCHDCATESDGKIPEGHAPTFNMGICDVCKVVKPVTDPKDYTYPIFKEVKK